MPGFASTFPTQQTAQPRLVSGEISWDLSTDVSKNLVVPQKIARQDRATAGRPILGFQTRIGGPRTVPNWVFYILKTRRIKDYIVATADAGTGTTLTFAAGDLKLVLVGFYVINLNTREIMEVTAKPTSTTATVTRGVGSIGTTDTGATDTYMILGYIGAEGDTKFFGLSKFPEVMFNYCTELQDTFSITAWEMAGGKMPGSETPQAKERMEHLENMYMSYEKLAIMSQRAKRQRGTDGKTMLLPNALDAICTENEKDFAGDVTEEKVLEWAEDFGRHGPKRRALMCSPRFKRLLGIALSGMQRQNTEVLRRAGLDITSYDANGMVLDIFTHPLFYDDPSTAADALNGTCYVTDFEDFKPVTIKSQYTGWFKWNMNVQNPGDRVVQDQLFCNPGFMYTFPEHYARGFVGSA